MKKCKVLIFVSTLIFILIGFLVINKNKDDVIENIIKTEKYSYLSNEAIDYIKDVYKETKTIVLTEKNKKSNEPYLNPEYISYLSLSSEEKKEIEVIPQTYIVEYEYTDKVESFPSSYDLRDVGGKTFISPMKNQSTLGICWAFAASEQAESYLLKEKGKTYEENPILFSPRQIDYATSYGGIIGYDNEFGYRDLASGGNFILASQVMANGVSLYNEETFPFSLDTNSKPLHEVLNYSYSNYELNSSIVMPQLLDVSENEVVNNYVSSIKNIVYNNGGAIISTQDPEGTCATTNTDNTLIIRADANCATTIAHDMQIIGWDDNYEYTYCNKNSYHGKYNSFCSQTVSGTGAWLVRNSWGTDTPLKNQYLYVAYDSNNYLVSAITDLSSMQNRTWDKSYVETPYMSSSNNISYYLTSDYTANYTKSVGPKEKLEKIKFSTINSNGIYNLSITVDSNKTYDSIFEPIETNYPGIYTIDLSSYDITMDDNMSVNIYSTNSGNLLYKGISVFTSFVDNDVMFQTDDINIDFIDDDYYDIDNLYVYSHTANIPSNTQITYELYDDENDLTAHITNLTDNYIAHNDIFSNMNILNLNAGHYLLKAVYENNSYNINLNITRPPIIHYHKNYPEDEIVSTSVQKNVETNLIANTFTKAGYTFNGWNTKSDGSGQSYLDEQPVTISEDLDLYAMWLPITYKIVFHSNNGQDETIEENFTYDEAKNLTLNTFIYTNHNFVYWASDENGIEPHYQNGVEVLNLTTNANDIINLYAVWNDNGITITFNANGGTGEMNVIDSNSYQNIQLSKNTFTKVGYTFSGWNTKSDGTGTNYIDEQIINTYESIILYAMWQPITYTITYNPNGGSGEEVIDEINYDENYTLRNNMYTYANHTFTNWNTSIDGSGTSYQSNTSIKNLTTNNHTNITLYAIWDEETKYQINIYPVDEEHNIVDKIEPNITLNTFKNNITVGTNYDAIIDLGTKEYIYTGLEIKILNKTTNETIKTYKCIVRGDTSGDGKINYLDYVNVYNHIKKVKHPELGKKLLTNEFAIAADMSGDNKINYLDYVKIYNKIKELKGVTN